jgi:N-acetylmuramoyl-L-alanine amidase
VAIDPGHGGEDLGVTGAKGIEEKAITLAVARRLRAALEGRLGVRILMTRDEDRQVSIAERTALANNNKADLFISLHANGSPRPAHAGAIIHTAAFAQEALDPSILSPVQLPAFGGGLRDIELVPWNLAQARHRERSDTLARLLVETFTDRVPLTPEPLGAGPFRVLQSANMPAVLIELGFLTNPEQEGRLATTDFQNTLAQLILDAIVRFRGEAPEGGLP